MNNQDNNIVTIEPKDVSNTLLQRLIKEVQFDKKNNVTAYDRVHNRHNRGGGCK